MEIKFEEWRIVVPSQLLNNSDNVVWWVLVKAGHRPRLMQQAQPRWVIQIPSIERKPNNLDPAISSVFRLQCKFFIVWILQAFCIPDYIDENKVIVVLNVSHTCSMTIPATLMFLLFYIVDLHNHERWNHSYSSSREWSHNWIHFTAQPHQN